MCWIYERMLWNIIYKGQKKLYVSYCGTLIFLVVEIVILNLATKKRILKPLEGLYVTYCVCANYIELYIKCQKL